jgi:hypothetical protein
MADLTTLANVKGWLGVTATTDDALLTRLISAASDYVQKWLNRTIAEQPYTETRDGTGGYVMMFANYPVSAVSSLTIDGVTIPAAGNAQGSGYLFSANKLVLVGGYQFTRGLQNVVVSYTAGFATTPNEIEQATIELISLRYKERDRIGQISKAIGGETVTFSQKDLSDAIQTTLTNYKKVILL